MRVRNSLAPPGHSQTASLVKPALGPRRPFWPGRPQALDSARSATGQRGSLLALVSLKLCTFTQRYGFPKPRNIETFRRLQLAHGIRLARARGRCVDPWANFINRQLIASQDSGLRLRRHYHSRLCARTCSCRLSKKGTFCNQSAWVGTALRIKRRSKISIPTRRETSAMIGINQSVKFKAPRCAPREARMQNRSKHGKTSNRQSRAKRSG